jgi:urea transporter
MLLQSEMLLWLAVVLAIQVNLGVAMLLTRNARSRRAEKAALNAPVVVESLQDLLNADAGQHLTTSGPGASPRQSIVVDDDPFEFAAGELTSDVRSEGRIEVHA